MTTKRADLYFVRWTYQGKVSKKVASNLTHAEAVREANAARYSDHSDHFESNQNCGYEWDGAEILTNTIAPK